MKFFLLELNEINFEHLRVYADRGDVPHLARLIEAHGVAETVSEKRYEDLEPWIQWVTAHTGLPLEDHRVFRLGDIVNHDIPQIWERLEEQGLRVGAVSPMNAKNRARDAAFFVPDPWTPTAVSARPLLQKLYGAVAQAVNDNAQGRLTPSSISWLIAGLVYYARPVNCARYAAMAAAAPRKPWLKAMFLDLLLADVFIRETRRTGPDFASLFLNAGAHIQHHYLFNSHAYQGEQKNPEWYVSPDQDPVGEVYRLYDRILGQVQRVFPEARIVVATGLHQDPHPEVTFYWRLKDHAGFLEKIGVPFNRVEPRMSRDFLIECASEAKAAQAERIIASARAENGVALFDVDNRGQDLFVTLTWPHDIAPDFVCHVGNRRYDGIRRDLAFVAIKNGQHNGIGYFIDTGSGSEELPKQLQLRDVPARICAALGVDWQPGSGTTQARIFPADVKTTMRPKATL